MAKKMKKLYWVICSNYRKFKNPKMSYILEKTLVISIICSKCEKIFQEEESIETLKILGLFKLYVYFKNRVKNLD